MFGLLLDHLGAQLGDDLRGLRFDQRTLARPARALLRKCLAERLAPSVKEKVGRIGRRQR